MILSFLKLYGATAVVFFALDLVWLGVVARDFYRDNLGELLRAQPLWPAALAFYAIYIAGVVVFAVLPSLQAESWVRAAALGAFLGLFAYATFDLTALALIRGFPGVVVAVDLAWGTVLTSCVAVGGYGLGRWLGIG